MAPPVEYPCTLGGCDKYEHREVLVWPANGGAMCGAPEYRFIKSDGTEVPTVYTVMGNEYPWKFGDKAFDYQPALERCIADNGACELRGLIAYPLCKVGYDKEGLMCTLKQSKSVMSGGVSV